MFLEVTGTLADCLFLNFWGFIAISEQKRSQNEIFVFYFLQKKKDFGASFHKVKQGAII